MRDPGCPSRGNRMDFARGQVVDVQVLVADEGDGGVGTGVRHGELHRAAYPQEVRFALVSTIPCHRGCRVLGVVVVPGS